MIIKGYKGSKVFNGISSIEERMLFALVMLITAVSTLFFTETAENEVSFK